MCTRGSAGRSVGIPRGARSDSHGRRRRAATILSPRERTSVCLVGRGATSWFASHRRIRTADLGTRSLDEGELLVLRYGHDPAIQVGGQGSQSWNDVGRLGVSAPRFSGSSAPPRPMQKVTSTVNARSGAAMRRLDGAQESLRDGSRLQSSVARVAARAIVLWQARFLFGQDATLRRFGVECCTRCARGFHPCTSARRWLAHRASAILRFESATRGRARPMAWTRSRNAGTSFRAVASIHCSSPAPSAER